MVFQKRLDYGFNGYQVPPVPRAARSARRRGTVSKRTDENKTCAFDLLATVAGNLLLEKVSSPASSNASSEKDQRLNVNQDLDVNCENKELKVEPRDEGSCDRKLFVSEQADNSNLVSKEFPLPQQDDHSGFSSIMTASNCSERLVTKNRDGGEIKNEVGGVCSKIEEGPPVYSKSGGCKLDDEANILVKDELSNEVLVGARSDVCSLENPVVSEDKPPSFFSSDSGAKAPLCGDHNLQSFLPLHRDNVKIVSRDDDENSSGCTRPIPRTRSKYFKQAPRIGDRRIRKILASKCWRATPKYKDDSDRSLKPNYRNRKDCYKRQRSQVVIPFKKRKLFDHSSAWATDGGINSQGYFNSPEKGIGDSSESCSKLQGGKGTARSVAGQHTSFRRRDSHVKLRIKSFRVPELFIEIPETATVGSLKRTVMEAVTAILSGGLRIGVFLQGQKVRDDNVTLLQSGISHDDQLDSLGFTLEPNPSQNPAPLFTTESPHFLPGDDKPQPLPLVRYISSPAIDNQGVSDLSPEPDVPNSGNSVESNHDSARSPTDMPIEKRTTDSKALVPALEMNAKALAVVPAIRKPKQCPEISQRRIRRPFSVTEVEALVHAVEKLGTGRWRDIKLRAFDDAKHRTYVDLKDKWKTLVHTARIAPQQRRGEPVPQELLDRVLNAHAYWSQQQAKQQLKQQSETCLLI